MFLVPRRSPRRVEHFSCLTRRNPTVRNSGIKERRFKRKKKKTLTPSVRPSVRVRKSIAFCLLFVFLFFLIESGTHMSPFSLLGSFQSRNNLFHPRFSSIYLKWKFFNYLTFFRIFFKIFVGPLDAYRLEFRENSTFSEFNEI